MKTTTIPSDEFEQAIGRVYHAIADDKARPILGAVLLEGDAEGLRLVAADNYRLAIADLYDEGDFSEIGKVVVPRDQLPVLRAFLKGQRAQPVSLEVDADRHLVVAGSHSSVSLRTIDGEFPNYRLVVTPDAPRTTLGINPDFIVDAARALHGAGGVIKISLPDDPRHPVLVKVYGYAEYIMPVRINGQPADPSRGEVAV